jgi:hypothetical protein
LLLLFFNCLTGFFPLHSTQDLNRPSPRLLMLNRAALVLHLAALVLHLAALVLQRGDLVVVLVM